MIASVPESQTLDVYNAFSNLVSSEVPPYLMSQVKEADAKGPEKVLVKGSALKNAVDLALKQAERIFTAGAGAPAFHDEADYIGQCKAALDLLL